MAEIIAFLIIIGVVLAWALFWGAIQAFVIMLAWNFVIVGWLHFGEPMNFWIAYAVLVTINIVASLFRRDR